MKTTERYDHPVSRYNETANEYQEYPDEYAYNDIRLVRVRPHDRDSKAVDISFVSGARAVGDIVHAVVNTRRGELQLNTRRGIPYVDGAFAGQSGILEWAMWMERSILAANGVLALTGFKYGTEFNGRRRALVYTATIQTEYGPISIPDPSGASTPGSGRRHVVTFVDNGGGSF